MKHNELYQRLGLPQQVVEALSEYGKTRTGSYLVKIEDLIADIGVMKGLEGKIKDFVGEDPDGFGMLWFTPPRVGFSKPASWLSSVLFPEPDGPKMQQISPLRISRRMSRSAYTFSSPMS